jgi:hypothetical protein
MKNLTQRRKDAETQGKEEIISRFFLCAFAPLRLVGTGTAGVEFRFAPLRL